MTVINYHIVLFDLKPFDATFDQRLLLVALALALEAFSQGADVDNDLIEDKIALFDRFDDW